MSKLDAIDVAPYTRNQIGLIVDRFWTLIPADDFANRTKPSAMPNPHVFYLTLGEEVIRICKKQGYTFEIKLKKTKDIEAWTRLLGAWVCSIRERYGMGDNLPSRTDLAKDMKIDNSSLTNFLNAKRPVTMRALTLMADYMNVKPMDIRPELGASEIYSRERHIRKSLNAVHSGLGGISKELVSIAQSDENPALMNLAKQLMQMQRGLDAALNAPDRP